MSSVDSIPGTYWPEGWSRERLVNASSQDILALSDGEEDRMYASLRSVLGTDGFGALMAEMSGNYKAGLAQEEASVAANGGERPLSLDGLPPETRAPFLRTLRLQFPSDDHNWGFVVFRTCCYEDEEAWAFCRARLESVIAASFDSLANVMGVAAARRRFKIHWVEDPQLSDAGVLEIAACYRALLSQSVRALSPGLAHPICLVVDEAARKALLESKIPTPSPWSAEKIIPFALAVTQHTGESETADDEAYEEHGIHPSFRVAVSTLTTNLFPTIADGSLTPGELNIGLSEHDIWYAAAGRHGTFTEAPKVD
ncbi:hypothetical protein LTR66_001036 [Elasticomyces elasticus]|nr:hypothetical protein LTR28_004791 [Elasticomyces elasticus]KAK4990672.1 hypothetical protein LTR50_002372 [Elasticomyces elasticus]KAK5000043.1 hypothetical protein LTR66_001036 [Elasticomyces elasticus]